MKLNRTVSLMSTVNPEASAGASEAFAGAVVDSFTQDGTFEIEAQGENGGP